MAAFAATVAERLPVAVVGLSGPLDQGALPFCLVTLRDCLADQPQAVVLDMTRLTQVSERAVHAFSDFAEESSRWPGADLMLCGGSTDVLRSVATVVARPSVEVFGSVAEARRAHGWELDRCRDTVVADPRPDRPGDRPRAGQGGVHGVGCPPTVPDRPTDRL